jgi:hypothetical protein
MITGNLLPRYVFIGMTEPKESPSLNDDLLGRKMDFLRNQASSEQKGRQEGRFGAIRLDNGNFLLTREIVTTIPAFPGCRFGELGAFWTLLADDSPTAGVTYLGLIWHVGATFRTRLHKIAPL